MPKSGIYIIISKVHPDRIYIGSSCNLKDRFNRHKQNLYFKKHSNIKLQNHVNKYGLHDLSFEIICICEKTSLIYIEQEMINEMKPFFNICKKANSRLGLKCSAQSRLRMMTAAIEKRKIAYYFRPH